MISEFYTLSAEFWVTHGNPIQTYQFLIGMVISTLIFVGVVYSRNFLLVDHLQRAVLLNYIPTVTLLITDRDNRKILLIGKTIGDGEGGVRIVYDMPQSQFASNHVRDEVEKIMYKEIGADMSSYQSPKSLQFLGMQKIADLEGYVEHDGLSLWTDKNKPRGKAYFLVKLRIDRYEEGADGKLISAGHSDIKPGYGNDHAVFVTKKRAKKMIDSSRITERERNKIQLLYKIIDENTK